MATFGGGLEGLEGLEFDLLGLVEVDLVVFFVAFFFCSLTCVEGGDMDG